MRRLAALAALLLLAASPEENQRILDERQALMKDMRSALGELVPMLKGEQAWQPAAVVRIADRLHAGAVRTPALFPAGTFSDTLFTMAVPEIRQRRAEFDAAAQAGAAAATRLKELAPARDAQALARQVEALGNTCTDCHQAFRLKR
jgi:cytochrome c556